MLDKQVIDFIKGNPIAQELLKHLHPKAETAVIVEYKQPDSLKEPRRIVIMFGARRPLLYQSSEAKEAGDVLHQLTQLGVLELNNQDNSGDRSYYALKGEWDKEKGPTIYSQRIKNANSRAKLHEEIGSKLPDIYSVDN